jgi:F-type H+-transporting ATPase subunit delta
MKIGKAAKRYARALFELAREENRLDAVHGDMKTIHGWLNESAAFAEFVRNPVIPPDTRSELMNKLLGDRAEPLTGRFLRFLDSKDRLEDLEAVCEVFDEIYDDRHNILKIEIVSATPLTEEQNEQIRTRFGSRLDKQIQSQTAIDPTLLGGFKVRVKDTIYDYSLQAQLEALRTRLLHA